MKIEQYIVPLLYRYQCVTVPGFGAFITEIHSAQLNEATHSFNPPKKQIAFNPNITNNDGLLANHIVLAEKISYEVAVNQILLEVTQWKNKIQETGELSIKNIGNIYLNSEKNISFVPAETLNFLTSSFGLNTFVSPLIQREFLKNEDREVASIPLNIEKKNSYSYLKYAAVFIAATTAIGTYGYRFYENKIAEETLLVETKVQKKVENTIQQATFFISNPLPAVTLNVKEEKWNYHIVAGAFRQEENAQNALNDLLKLGFKARRIAPNKHGLFPVLYGSYGSYIEAKKAMTEIQKTENKEAWMLIGTL